MSARGADEPAPGVGGPKVSLAVGLAAGIPVLEAAGLVVFVAVVVVRALGGDASSALGVALLAVILLVWAAGLVAAARGLAAARRWARAPLVVSGLLLLLVGVSLVQGGSPGALVGWPLVVASVVATGALFAPAVTALLDEARP